MTGAGTSRSRRGYPRRRAGVIALASLVVGACNVAPSPPAEAVHNEGDMPGLIAQRMMYCDDGSRVDVDFMGDGLRMAVTWLPKGKTELLSAGTTGDEYRGTTLRAVVAGGSIAFTRAGGDIRICHRNAEGK